MKKNKSLPLYLIPMLIFLLISVSAGASVQAQDPDSFHQYMPIVQYIKIVSPRWIGPEGGTVNILLADPLNSDILYAGTLGTGVYKTVNGGANWIASNKNITTLTIQSLAIDPDNSNTIYAGTDGQGVYKSTDAGATWNPANQGIGANSIVYGLAVNNGNSYLVYAGTKTKGTNNGVIYKSNDHGDTWSTVFSQTGSWVNSLAVNPYKPNIILAATEYNGPYIAKSYGNSGEWYATTVNSGNRNSGMAVAFDPRSTTSRAYFSSLNNDLYRSSNNGDDWNLSDSGLGDSNLSRNGIAIRPSNPNVVYLAASSSSIAGVLRSEDSGSNWAASGLKGKKVNTVAVPSGNNNTVYAGTYQEGVYKSIDGGITWNRSTTGLGNSYVTGMAFKGLNTYYSSTYGGGVFKSTDAGGGWTEFNTNMGDIYINGLVQHPVHPNIIFALTANAGLRRYDTDTNTGWSASAGLPQQFDRPNIALRDDPETALATTAVGINGMAFAPSNPNIAYLATNGGGVYASSDSGTSFARKGLTNEVVKSVAVNRSNPDILYVTTSTKGVVKRSIDGGTAWVSFGLPDAQLQQTVNVVAMWPGENDSVCVGTTNGVWKYNGATWEAAGLQGYTVTSLAPDPYSSNRMMAGTSSGAFTSRDHQNWTPVNSTVGSINVASLSFNASDWGIIYVGTIDHGAVRLGLVP